MKNPSYTPEQVAQIAALLRDGWSASQIAKPLGRTRNAIVGVVHRDPRLREIGFKTLPPAKLAIGRKRRELRRNRERAAAAGMVVDDVPVEVIYPMPVEETPPPPPEPDPDPIFVVREVPLSNLGAFQCKWPMWGEEVTDIEDKTFCCAPRRRDQSYCDKHRAKAYAIVRGPSQRKALPGAGWKALAKGAL